MANSLGPGRPSTACYQCKQQKVRCSGDSPFCRRCSRMNAICIYPNGPSSTRRRSLSRLDNNSCAPNTTRVQSNQERTPTTHHDNITDKGNQPLVNGNNNPSNPLNAFGLPDQLGIPESLLSDLIDTYFSHQYNARLLLHKETLQTQRRKGTVRLHVLLSVCAIGANFCRDANKAWSLKDFAYLWAERAGKLVLNEVENPNEDNVVTFANLALFWYMQGAWRRSYMHKGNAMQTVHVLNLLSNANKGKTPLNEEMSRRRYWACYLINCHASNSMFAISPPEKLATFPLPWREADFESGTSEYPSVLFGSKSTNGAIYSELIRAMTHWSSVDSLMKASEATHQTRLATIHQLDAEIRKWWEYFPPDLKLTESNILTFRRVDLAKLLLIHVVYFQCLCVLHASIVPLFTWGQEESPNTVALQMSAQIAYENACRTSDLLAMVWERDHDVSDYTSFVAYAAYCSYAIQIPFQWCLDAAVRERAQRNTALNLQILQATSQYWRFNWLLACYAQYLGKIHFHSQLGLEGEPKNVNPEKLNTFRLGASRARVSLLSLNGILWKDDGCSVQGEEVTDLGLDPDRVSSSPQQQPVASWVSEQSTMSNRPEGESFGNEDSSVTTLYDGSAAGLRRTGLSDQLLSGFFQPLLQPSHMLDTAPGGFGIMNIDNMSFNMDDVWGTSRTGGVP